MPVQAQSVSQHPAADTAPLRCAACQYDLRTLPSDGVCPECGIAIAHSAQLAARRPKPGWAECGVWWRRRVLAAIALLVLLPLPGAFYDNVARVPQAPWGTLRETGPDAYLWEGLVPTFAGAVAIVLLFTPGRSGPRGRRWFRYLQPLVYIAVAIAVGHQLTWTYMIRVRGTFDLLSQTDVLSRILQCLVLIVTPAILLVLADILRRADARRLAWGMVAVAGLVLIVEAERVARIPRYPRTRFADWPSDNLFLRIDFLAPWWEDLVDYVLNIDRNSSIFALPTDWLSMQGSYYYFVLHGPTETLKWLAALAAGRTLLAAHWRLPASTVAR